MMVRSEMGQTMGEMVLRVGPQGWIAGVQIGSIEWSRMVLPVVGGIAHCFRLLTVVVEGVVEIAAEVVMGVVVGLSTILISGDTADLSIFYFKDTLLVEMMIKVFRERRDSMDFFLLLLLFAVVLVFFLLPLFFCFCCL